MGPWSSDLTLIDIEGLPTGPERGHRWQIIAVAAAVVAIVVGALVLAARDDATVPQVPADQATTVPPDTATAQEIADRFMGAWVAGRGEAVAAMITPGGPWGDLVIGPFGGYEGWPNGIEGAAMASALHEWYRATGWEFHHERCELTWSERTSASGSLCSYSYENDLTRHFERPPVSANMWLEIDDGAVTYVGDMQMFDADADISHVFSDWVLSNHPDDVELMYAAPGSLAPRLDQKAIELWERHLDEFTASPETAAPLTIEPRTRAAYGARVRTICAAASVRFGMLRAGLPNSDPGGAAALHEAAVRIGGEALEELRALRQPEEDRAEIDTTLAHMDQEIALEAQAATAAAAGDTALAERLSLERVDLTHSRPGGADFQYCPVAWGA